MLSPRSTREGRFSSSPAGRVRSALTAAVCAVLITLAGQLLIVVAVETMVLLFPETVLSKGYTPVHVAVSEMVQLVTAALAGGVAERMISGREVGSLPRRHLAVAAAPVATMLVIDLLAVAGLSTAWWRLLLDVAVTGLGAVLGGMWVRRR